MYDFEKMGIESSPTVHSCGIMTARQFIRTKLTVGEASSVLDEAMKHFGWRAGACMRRFSCLATRLYLYFHPSIHQHTHTSHATQGCATWSGWARGRSTGSRSGTSTRWSAPAAATKASAASGACYGCVRAWVCLGFFIGIVVYLVRSFGLILM